ncbi:glycosyltransferase [Sulfurirhabdus autotrophica]|uniref:GT2 family glycosyltransferase n=1 Tax=Sulfurirhabdus autotrophica TaxID=1706046 RepID=A0A4V2W0R2_9PROT|nr:glycosyltransferase [Sulfurirhabdus autotrophica]TCV79102.1 GT2 family glycosyltransferase [Sulfurirhabdus autotrophica]
MFPRVNVNTSAKDNSVPPEDLHIVCDIVIPIHNAAHWVDWCIDEVIRYDSNLVGRVILVDDGSNQEQSQLIKQISQRFHKALFVQTPGTDHGFGIACNHGASLSSAPYLLFLNTDCLLTEGCLESLLAPFNQDPNIVLSCPVSNNSPALTLPMFPGYSYVDMNRLCQDAFIHHPPENKVLDACTVVGNCLMVRKNFFEKAGGFDMVWGKGYGEETDLHMKAFSLGLRGVVALNSYVYHFGSGTFQYEAEQEQIKKRNYTLFMSKWAKEYQSLAKQCSKKPPIPQLKKHIQKSIQVANPLEIDVLFYLPALNQSTGGIHAVVAICNALIRAGVRAGCVVVGDIRRSGSNAYQEPLLFEFLHHPTNQHFLADKNIAPKIVVSTIFTSAPIVNQYALARCARHLQYIQGYEAYFDAGRRFNEFVEALQFGDAVITTSRWLEKMISRHLPQDTPPFRIPLGVNEYVFYPSNQKLQISKKACPVIGAVLRSVPDKGQGMVLEVIDRLIKCENFHAIIFRSASYTIPTWWLPEKYTIVELPAEQLSIAQTLRGIDVFLDASLHEGFGLMPLEALACGCWVVCSDSGGVRDFIKDGENGFIVREVSDPEVYIQKIKASLNLPPPEYNEEYRSSHSVEQYVAKIKEFVRSPVPYNREVRLQQIAEIHDLPILFRFYGMLLTAYMKIQPRIPRRIHLALQALLGQSM